MRKTLEVEGLNIANDNGVPIVTDVSFSVAEGECVGIVGESGSGKSLTGLACLGLLPRGVRLVGGQVLVAGESITGSGRAVPRRRKVAMVFQNPMTSLNPSMRVGAQIEEAIRRNAGPAGTRAPFGSAVELLELVDIPDPARRAHQWPHELSGGQRQRVVIAIALACNSKVLIADEPTTALDVTTQAGIVALIDRLRRELNLSVVFISHDLALISNVSSRLLVMYAGEIVETGKTGQLLRAPKHPYLQGLLGCIPRTGARDLRPLPGRIPRPEAYPEGCRFAPRCAHVTEICHRSQVMTDVGPGRQARCIRAGELLLSDPLAEGRPVR